ncbi:MAG: flippase [bacterium]
MSISKNYIYNLVYKLLLILLPVITLPYIARVLGSESIGINAYTNSIAQYFILFGTLGISLYGKREIAYVRDDVKARSETFLEIYLLQLVCTLFSLVIYFIFFIYIYNIEYTMILLLQSIHILSAAMDISWFFIGMEDFKKTVTRNLFVKAVGVFFIFLLINDANDLWLYILIIGFSNLVGQLSLWIYIRKYLVDIKINIKNIFKHFIPNIQLFIPQIAIKIYVVMDKTMLGIFTTESQVGYYDMSQRIVRISLALVTSMGAVMLPRISNLHYKNKKSKINLYIERTFKFASFLAMPIMFGLIGISDVFVPLFLGSDFRNVTYLIVLISPITLFIAWSNVIGLQYMLPIRKEKEFTISVIIGALAGFFMNLLLIPLYQAVGACIATVIAEFLVIFTQILFVRKDILVKNMYKEIWKPILSSFLMFLVVRLIGFNLIHSYKTIIFQIITGIMCYGIFSYLLKDKMFYYILKKLSSLNN